MSCYRAIVVFASVFVALSVADAAPVGSEAKHTVVLLVDDFGWADLAYRATELPTPHLDQLRADGVTFTNAYAASPTCSPSRASLLTGRHPARYRLVRHVSHAGGEWHNWPDDPARMPSRNWLPLAEPTYAEVLTAAGHRCVFVGKWHLGPETYFPEHQGFQETFGVTAEGHPRDYYPPYFRRSGTYRDAEPDKYLTDRVTDDAVAVIASHDTAHPLHLSLFWYGVHAPLIGKREHLETLKACGLEGRERHFAAMTLSIDESVGRVRAALEAAGIADETLLVFAGDQGGPLDNAPLRGNKHEGAINEGGARIPLVFVWPGHTTPGNERAAPVTTLDIAPTLLNACGVDPADPLDGVSLAPLLAEDGTLPRDQIIIYRSYVDRHAAIRVGDWKLVVSRSGDHGLYYLAEDVGEANDLYQARPEVAGDLLSRFRRWEAEAGVDDVRMADLAPP